MINLAFGLLALTARRAKADFLRKGERMAAVQADFLRSLLHTHRHTELGQHYRFTDILAQPDPVEGFCQRVPVQPYTFFQPYIERMAEGETNVLTADPLIYFNMTSGSTSQKKLIPVTRRSRQAIARANQVAMGFVIEAAQRQEVPLGKMLFTSQSQAYGITPSGIPYGPISTSDLRLMNPLARLVFAYPFEALQITDSPSRHYVCLLFALRNPNLRMVSATFPVLGLQLVDYLEKFSEQLIQNMETGTLADWLQIEPELRQKLAQRWSAQPQRAAELRQIFQRHGQLTPILAWPHLSFITTARGGTSNFYLERFPDYFGETPIFGGTYSSAEATFGVHRDFNTDSVYPAIATSFIEFIPESQWDTAQPTTVLPSDVKVGDRYRIVVSNYSGFYRYDVGDVVEIIGFHGAMPHFTFRHRRGGMISSTTEKTTEFHVSQVMQILQQTLGVKLTNFCITLSDDKIPAHYLVNIEVAPDSTLDNPQEFLQQFDQTLKEIHASYGFKRADVVPPPRLRILAPGSFETVRQRLIQRGATAAQLKFPLVSENRQLLAGLKILQEACMDDAIQV
ncbi:MAG: GH3 auxin-responsive promoter family protein [Cyanothece sp. SIO2G6]|nr:GH3 auxin-responsive promoter family protein [Cyanothece sp. SIO2G6]